MLFNSYEFMFMFLPAVLIVYFIFTKLKWISASRVWLAGSSVFFYSWWNINNLPIIAGSILFNYLMGAWIIKGSRKRLALTFGIIVNVSALFYYKYFDFFLDNVNHLFRSDMSLLNLILPLGISFFTFTQMTFLVDAYRGEAKEYNFINTYCL